MQLPFFDSSSSARYLADLLQEADPPFTSIALIGQNANILSELLQPLLQGTTITCGEISADVLISFDTVHHLPTSERTAYVKQLAALAKRELIIACPLGTDLQKTIYRSLEKFAVELQLSISELTEAVKHGLPTPSEAASWAHGYSDLDLFYAGDVAFVQEQATRFLEQSKLSPLRRRWHKITSAHAPSASEMELPPETVPMRRHRRLYLLIRKKVI